MRSTDGARESEKSVVQFRLAMCILLEFSDYA